MKGFQVVGRRLVEQCFVDGETETLWKMMVMMISMMVVMVMMVVCGGYSYGGFSYS